ncbi:MAG: ABC transporter permease [Chloroflexota bacterium]
MRNIWVIAKREFKLYLSSPVAYVVTFVILLILGIFFFLNVQVASQQQGFVPGADSTLIPLATMLVLLMAGITTRLLAEEQRLGTIELLLTAPVRDWELVVGKWLGAFMLILVIIAITAIYPALLHFQLVDPGIDMGPVISGYLGIVLLSAALVGIGVAVSAMFNNQIAAFLTTMGVMVFVWWIIGPIAQVAGPMSKNASLLTYLDFQEHFISNLVRGVLDLSDIVYFLSVTVLTLFVGSVLVETRRWR